MRKSPEIAEKICSRCGCTFSPKSGSQKFCSDCGKKRNKERIAAYKKREKEKINQPRCCICGGKFGELINGKPYCWKHRARYFKHGAFDLPKQKSLSTIELSGSDLSIKTASGAIILADADDRELLSGYTWRVSIHGYAVTNIGRKIVYMHRLVLKRRIDDELEVDHINGNKLDNRKQNLRACTHKENLRNLGISKNNTSGYPGVSTESNGKFRAVIMVDGKEINLGCFESFDEAVTARRNGEDIYVGEYAGHIKKNCQRRDDNE